MRLTFALPGFHRVSRGAEVALESIAAELARADDVEVTVVGSGDPKADREYRFVHVPSLPRERFERVPKVPPLRSEYAYEEASFVASYLPRFRPSESDVTVTCSYPFLNWMLARWPPARHRPRHVFVTQNGDWPAYSDMHEYRLFRCDGLVCTNPDYYERNRDSWRSALIPNGVDVTRFHPGALETDLGLPSDRPVVLIVAALIESKRVCDGIRAASRLPDAYIVVAGDGPLRASVDATGESLAKGRYRRLTLSAAQMPDLYRSATVVLHPPLHESFGNVHVEALASGVPIVAHDYAVTRWIFGDSYEGLVDITCEERVVEALRRVVAGDRPPADELARVAVDRFAWSVVAREYRAFFERVLAGSAA